LISVLHRDRTVARAVVHLVTRVLLTHLLHPQDQEFQAKATVAGRVIRLLLVVLIAVVEAELARWEVRERKAEQLVLLVTVAMGFNRALTALRLITAVAEAVALVLTAQAVWAVAAPLETLGLLERLILEAAVELLGAGVMELQAALASSSSATPHPDGTLRTA
jgi:hypothetical protein